MIELNVGLPAIREKHHNRTFFTLVKSYLKLFPNVTEEQVRKVFKGTPANAQWENSLVIRLSTVEERNDTDRYYTDEEDILYIENIPYVVLREWTEVALNEFIKKFNEENVLQISISNAHKTI